MIRAFTMFVATAVAAFCFCASSAKADITVEPVAAWGGPVHCVQVEGDIAYIGAGRRLVVLDISDPADISELGSLDLGQTVKDLVVSKGYAYVAVRWANEHQFVVVDVSVPAEPELIWTHVAVGAAQVDGVEVDVYGQRAFVNDAYNEIVAFDISDPTDVQFLDVVAGVALPVESVIVGNLLYTVNHFSLSGFPTGLRTYDLNTEHLLPNGLIAYDLVGSVDLSPGINGEGMALEVNGSRAYIVASLNQLGSTEYLFVVDISNPRAPAIIGSTDQFSAEFDHTRTSIRAYAGHLFMTGPLDSEQSLSIFDVTSDPANPTLVGEFQTHAHAFDVQIFGDRAYLSDDGEGLIVLDLTNSVSPVRVGNYHSPSDLTDAVKEGDLLYVADRWNGFTVLDVSDPEQTPEVVGVYQTAVSEPVFAGNGGIDVRDGVAYLAEGTGGVKAISVVDPTNPAVVGQFLDWLPSYYARCVRIHPNASRLHLAGDMPSPLLLNSDISTPNRFIELGTLSLPASAVIYDLEVDTSGDFVHLAGSALGNTIALWIVNVSNPTAPFIESTSALGALSNSTDVALQGSLRLAVNNVSTLPRGSNPGLYIHDVSDPANPVQLAYVESSRMRTIAVENDRAYSIGGFDAPGFGSIGTLAVFDISSPSAPVALSYSLDTAPITNRSRILVEEPYLFITSDDADVSKSEGLVINEVVGLPGASPADLNEDDLVNAADLALLLGAWSIPSGNPGCGGTLPCLADINGDTFVNAADLALLLGAWTV